MPGWEGAVFFGDYISEKKRNVDGGDSAGLEGEASADEAAQREKDSC